MSRFQIVLKHRLHGPVQQQDWSTGKNTREPTEPTAGAVISETGRGHGDKKLVTEHLEQRAFTCQRHQIQVLDPSRHHLSQ